MSSTLLPRVAALVLAAVMVGAGLSAAANDGSPTQSPGRPCFIVPAHWNVALDNPLPRC